MIARIWKGYADADKAHAYAEHLEQSVLPELRQIEGFQGVYLLRRDTDKGVEFTVMKLWESMETIHKFAGDDAETAVVAPAAQAVLRGYDTTVAHHQIVLQE
jgi:heme-degrading monooxygenase HmoA